MRGNTAYFITLFLALILPGGRAIAQQDYGRVIGRVFREKPGTSTMTPLMGASVILISQKDTLKTATDNNGWFNFKQVRQGRIRVQVSYIGLNTLQIDSVAHEGKTLEINNFNLKESVFEIDAVTVKAMIPYMTVKGDTLIYNAAAVKTKEGDVAAAILEQMPGVEITETSLKILNKEVKSTYIDGKLIFGSDPMAAVNNLLASDVIKIKVYDEAAYKRDLRASSTESKRVIDIETRSKLVSAAVGHVLVSGGADMAKDPDGNRQQRYGVGATANFFSEYLLLSANVSSDNINRLSNNAARILSTARQSGSYNRANKIDAGYEQLWKPEKAENGILPAVLRINYSYNDTYSLSEKSLKQFYFPSDKFDSREYSQTNRTPTTTKTHSSNLMFQGNHIFQGLLVFTHDLTLTDKNINSQYATSDILDDNPAVRVNSSRNSSDNDLNLIETIKYYRYISKKILLSAGFGFSYSDSDGSGVRLDEQSSTATVQRLESSSEGIANSYNAEVGFATRFDKNPNFGLTYNYDYSKDHKEKLSVDVTDPQQMQTDIANTYNFSRNNQTHSITPDISFRTKGISISASVKAQSATVNLEDRFPTDEITDKRFDAILPNIGLNLTRKNLTRTEIKYSTSVSLPSVEQLRDRIDDSNILSLRAGNPSLNQEYIQQITYSDSWIQGKATTITLESNISYSKNAIVEQTEYFTQDTVLAQWNDYNAIAQSSLTTYTNIDGRMSASIKMQFTTIINPIRFRLQVTPSFTYTSTPDYVEQQLLRTKEIAPQIELNLNSNFSRVMKLSLLSSTQYVYYTNTQSEDYKYIRQTLGATLGINNIFKAIRFEGRYSAGFYRYFNDGNPNTDTQILNLLAAYKFLKGNAEVIVTAFDVLNRNKLFQTRMRSNYVETTYTRSFGRYFMINLAFKFNKVKPGMKYMRIMENDI